MTTATRSTSVSDDEYELDPVFLSCVREARWILAMWGGCFAWTLTVSLSMGYPDSVDPQNFDTVFGIPAWVAWGICLPWLAANIVTIWFSLTQMEDAELDADTAAEQPGDPSLDSMTQPDDAGDHHAE